MAARGACAAASDVSNRRQFITLLGSATASAQQPGRTYRIMET